MTYKPPFLLFNKHLETIYPSLFRKVDAIPYVRERITTPDDDFLDLDWLKQGSSKLVIISHGLEGNTDRAYIKGMAKAFFEKGYNVLAWNYRGCSGEMNKQLRFYHSGASDDLGVVIQHAVEKKYIDINLIGFSLGGNLSLKYLGEGYHPKEIKKAVTFSVPLDLHHSCIRLSRLGNWIYANRFLKSLKKKVIEKSKVMREIDTKGIEKISTLIEFDDRYTAPVHGYRDAVDYYQQCSSIHFLKNIRIPTLIVNAVNDPFLSAECFPNELLKEHAYIQFETPFRGGHVGFAQFHKNGLYWSEQRALDFLQS